MASTMTHYDCQPAMTEAEEQAELEESLAELEAGQVVPWSEVKQWMDSLGTEHELPIPTPRGSNLKPSP